MQVRRWERALGAATREGQAAGEVATQADGPRNRVTPSATLPKATDFATHQELYGRDGKSGIYALTDNATPEQFEDALTEARKDGNVSRASRAAPAPRKPSRTLERSFPRPHGPHHVRRGPDESSSIRVRTYVGVTFGIDVLPSFRQSSPRLHGAHWRPRRFVHL